MKPVPRNEPSTYEPTYLEHLLVGLVDVQLVHQLAEDGVGELVDDVVVGLAGATRRHAGLDVQDGGDDGQRLLHLEREVSVLVHAEYLGLVDEGQLLHVLAVLL